MAKTLLPREKFTGHSDGPGISEYLPALELLFSVNESNAQKAAWDLAVCLENDANTFYMQLPRADCGSYRQLHKHLKGHYEDGRALLK